MAGGALFWGCQMGWDGGQPWQRDTELLYSLQREKCHPPEGGVGFSFPPPSPALPHTAVNETVLRETDKRRPARRGCCPGARPRERANRATWHFWCKHVACWRAKSLAGGLYLFFKELVRFIYTRQRLHGLEERGETHSLSARSPASPAAAPPRDRKRENATSRRSPGSRSKRQQKEGCARLSEVLKPHPLPPREPPPPLFTSSRAAAHISPCFFLKLSFCSGVLGRQSWLLSPVPGKTGAQSPVSP